MQLRRSEKAALRNARVSACERIEIYRLASHRAFLQGRHSKALRWLRRALVEGERMGAWPDVARTHLALGRTMSDLATRRRIAGRDALGHLDRASELFRALGLPDERF